MKIQIWGKSKCFDTKKAERYFKERRIPYQAIDLLRYGMSRGELTSVKNAVGLDAMLNPKAADYAFVQHLACLLYTSPLRPHDCLGRAARRRNSR